MTSSGIGIVLITIATILSINRSCIAQQPPAEPASFTLIKNANGIQVYERWYFMEPGGKQARELKAIFTVKTDAMAGVDLIKDAGRGTEWNSKTTAYQVLSLSENRWICRIEYDFPWPLNNQDCVLEYWTAQLFKNSLEVSFKGIEHPAFPVRDRVQRIPGISGKWIFTDTADGATVEYFITTKPSSSFPAWLTDPIIRSNLIETLSAFRAILAAAAD